MKNQSSEYLPSRPISSKIRVSMRLASLSDHESLLDFLRQDPHNNIWHIANLCCLPLYEQPWFRQYCAFVDGKIQGALQFVYGVCLTYWQNEIILPQLAPLVPRHSIRYFNGVKSQIQPLLPYLNEALAIQQEDNIFCRLETKNFRGENQYQARQAHESDHQKLVDFYRQSSFTRTVLSSEKRIDIALGYGSCFLLEKDGQVVSAAHTFCEAPEGAQIMGVATLDSYTGRGYATSVMAGLCQHLLSQGKTVYLNYKLGNLPAEKVYQEKIGFQPIAEWESVSISR